MSEQAKELIKRLAQKYELPLQQDEKSAQKQQQQLEKIKANNDLLKYQIKQLDDLYKSHPIRKFLAKICVWFKSLFYKNYSIGLLRNHFMERYKNAAEQYDSGFLTDTDVQALAEHEDTVVTAVIKIRNKMDEDSKHAVYKAIINNDKSLQKELEYRTKEQIIVLENELKHIKKLHFYNPLDIEHHDTNLKRLETRIASARGILKKLQTSDEEEKRGRGRPKKEEPGNEPITLAEPEETSAEDKKTKRKKHKSKKLDKSKENIKEEGEKT